MEEMKELSKVILDTCEKEFDKTIGFMLTKREAEMFAFAILSAGYIKKSEVECDEEKLIHIMCGYGDPMGSRSEVVDLAHTIANNLKSIIK